jgi:hypothetical protein
MEIHMKSLLLVNHLEHPGEISCRRASGWYIPARSRRSRTRSTLPRWQALWDSDIEPLTDPYAVLGRYRDLYEEFQDVGLVRCSPHTLRSGSGLTRRPRAVPCR